MDLVLRVTNRAMVQYLYRKWRQGQGEKGIKTWGQVGNCFAKENAKSTNTRTHTIQTSERKLFAHGLFPS